MGLKALDTIWACLLSGEKLRIEELARRTGLPQEVVAEVIGFLARYDFVSVAPDSSLMLRYDATSPHVVAVFLKTLVSVRASTALRNLDEKFLNLA